MAAAFIEIERDLSEVVDQLRAYKVVIDGEVVGHLRAGESHAFEVDAGSHELFLGISWCRSEKLTVDVSAGQTVAFRCQPSANTFTQFYWVSVGRHRYIKLIQIGPENPFGLP